MAWDPGPSFLLSFPHLPSQVDGLVCEPPKEGHRAERKGTWKEQKAQDLFLVDTFTAPSTPPHSLLETGGQGWVAKAEGQCLRYTFTSPQAPL